MRKPAGTDKKTYAHGRIRRMIDADLIPHPCSILCTDCKGQAESYDHYLGYDFPDNVEPVCNRCHVKREYSRGVRRGIAIRKEGHFGPLTKNGSFLSSNAYKLRQRERERCV